MAISLCFVGIGTGNPAHLSQEARRQIAQADIILIPDKGTGKSDLADIRRGICASIMPDADQKIITFKMPRRAVENPDYIAGVLAWHDAVAQAWQSAIMSGPKEAERVVMLIWGDPALYDSSLRIAERLDDVEITVVPGITAPQVLAAAHKIPFNALGEPFVVTTGRRLRDEGWPPSVDTAIVMLDGSCSFEVLDGDHFDIYWGAFLGMPEQMLISGRLGDVSAQIIRDRKAARAAHGWIMDTYLLRKRR